MIWSVSTLLRRSGTPTPVCLVNFSMSEVLEIGGSRKSAADRGGRSDGHGHQVGATTLALSPLEVSVRRRRASFSRRELVGIHAQTHRAASPAPLTTGLLEDDVESFLLRLQA